MTLSDYSMRDDYDCERPEGGEIDLYTVAFIEGTERLVMTLSDYSMRDDYDCERPEGGEIDLYTVAFS